MRRSYFAGKAREKRQPNRTDRPKRSCGPPTLREKVTFLKKSTPLPVCVGFGISSPEQAGQVAALSDGVVVGSAIVDRIGKLGKSPQLISEVVSFLRPIAEAVHAA